MTVKNFGVLLDSYLEVPKGKNNIQGLMGNYDPKNMANIMNDYLTDIGTNLLAEMPESLLDVNYDFDNSREKFAMVDTNVEEVKNLMLKISNNKSTGIDGVPLRFLKMVIDVTAPILCYIINLSMRTMKVPRGWKTCVLTPLFKKAIGPIHAITGQ